MLLSLLIGSIALLISIAIQVVVVVLLLRHLLRIMSDFNRKKFGFDFDFYVICVVMLSLFVGHVVQVSIWAGVFQYLGEFPDFPTAFYHSMVNFSSLGYGDMVMSERWRLLGAMEASNGVLMFGLSAGFTMAVLVPLFARISPTDQQVKDLPRD
jgi:hypothetical protein